MLFTPEHDQFRASVRKLVEEEINPYADEWEDAEIFPAHELFPKLGAIGAQDIKLTPAPPKVVKVSGKVADAKGTAIAAGQIVLGLVNISAIVFHNQIAEDRTRTCISGQPCCSNPPYFDSDRTLLAQVDTVKYVSAGLFWALYAYGVWDAHKSYVPRIETEITPGQPGGAVKLEWGF